MVDIKLITFITVAKTKNFTKAANILNITQPAISQHIKALENYYGVKVLCKKGRNMELTEEGLLLYKYAKKIDRLSKLVENQLKNKMSIVKKYNIGATLTIGGYVLPKIIGDYRKENENIDILLHVNNTEKIIEKLYNGTIDFGIIEGPFNKTKINYNRFKYDQLVLAVSSKHKFANRKSVNIEEVLEDKLILREHGSGTRQVFENHLLKSGYSLDDIDIYMEIGNITALISLVKSNLGVTIISKEAIKSSIESGSIKSVDIEDFDIIREFNFIYLDDVCGDFRDDFIGFCKRELI